MKQMEENKKVIVVGGAGFLGTYISKLAVAHGYNVVVLDVHKPSFPGVSYLECITTESIPKEEVLMQPYAVINVAGTAVFGKWTKSFTTKMYNSRILTTQNLVALFKDPKFKPSVFVSRSTVGYYGESGSAVMDENSPIGDGLFATMSHEWEETALYAKDLGIRTIIIRCANILGERGFLNKLAKIYTSKLGGFFGNEQQWFSWIHVKDLGRIFLYPLENRDFSGIVNGVSPEPITHKEFSEAFKKVLGQNKKLTTPKMIFKMLYLDFAKVLLQSIRVTSIHGDRFSEFIRFRNISDALIDIYPSKKIQ